MRPRFAFLFFCAPFVGCVSIDLDFGGGGSWGGGSSGTSSSSTTHGDYSSNVIHLTRGDRIELLLLVEGSASGGTHSGNPAGGEIWTPTGRVVNWTCPTRHGTLREFRIDDTIFPLEGGRVFHIDVRDGRTLVRQLDLDPHAVASGPGSIRENVRAFAPKNAVVAGFCERCNPAE